MLTWESSKIVGYEGGVAVELRRGHCLSTDTKPTGPSIGNGSYLREMDTGDEYEYDAENDIWRASSGGGGGGGGGAGLPAVTSEDNGDVLTVVEGEWAKAAPSGGGSDIFVVHFEVFQDEDSGTLAVTTDKTAAEILAANTAGKLIVGKCAFYYTLPARATMDVYVDSLSELFYWCYPDSDGSTNWLYKARVSWDGNSDVWSVDEAYYELTPKVWS